jgi:hypothetical protein
MSNFVAFSPDKFPSLLLVLVWLGLMRSLRHSGYGIAFLSLGATAIHEVCHLVVGTVLNAKPVSLSLWPKRQGKHWVLGSVGFSNLNIWNSAFVAFAPLAMLPLGWAVFQLWMLPAFRSGGYLSWLLAGYVAACCGFACLPSTTDIKVGALSAAMYCAIAYGLWRAIF